MNFLREGECESVVICGTAARSGKSYSQFFRMRKSEKVPLLSPSPLC
ncbi:hypothetical protein HMPREF3038_02036 [Akkermansia sp. KLE1797]|nr:hypothetical protein HMPREF3038_02036 [Akkermansia sp. KLE1797]